MFDLKVQHKYLAHIDILRAIAVFLVIFNHLNITFFSGGFIGVDVFFVISGFLITKNIVQEIQEKRFSLLNFYRRRIIRLAPAFYTMLIFCSLIFGIFSTSSELHEYLKSLIAVVCLSVNIYFWQSLSDYFSINAHATPLLHIWSLSLEEQFYLFWPTLLIFTLKNNKIIKVILLVGVFLSSLLYSYHAASHSPILAYYLLPTRFFEFMVGAFLVYLPNKNFSSSVRFLFSVIGLGAIFIFSFILNKNSIFPGLNALLICYASAIYIYFARIDQDKCQYKPLLYLGKISYPMYLWHWPIIVFLNMNSIALDAKYRLVVVVLTVVLSWLTYEKVEQTARAYIKNYKNIIKGFFILPCLIVVILSLKSLSYLSAKEEAANHASTLSIQCIDRKTHPIPECFLGDLSEKNVDILLLGDSHANAQRGFVDILVKDAKFKGYEITYSSTAFLANIERFSYFDNGAKIELVPTFRTVNDAYIQSIRKNHFKYVVFGGYFPHNAQRSVYSTSIESPSTESSHQVFINGLDNAVEIILKSGAIPVIINDNPILQKIDINCNLRTTAAKEKCFFDRAQHNLDFKDWESDLKVLKDKYQQLIVLDFTSIICSESKCYSYLNDIPLYRDNQHLSYTGSTEIGLQYLKKYGNPLKSHEK